MLTRAEILDLIYSVFTAKIVSVSGNTWEDNEGSMGILRFCPGEMAISLIGIKRSLL
jgi:hypothetical protein